MIRKILISTLVLGLIVTPIQAQSKQETNKEKTKKVIVIKKEKKKKKKKVYVFSKAEYEQYKERKGKH